jgi:hypothetical protein
MARSTLWLLLVLLLIGSPAVAADRWVGPRAPVVVVPPPEPPPVEVVEQPGLFDIGKAPVARVPEGPQIRYGCRRIWRCDATVCEWRRGCRGVYGYVEGPYYTLEFARRQWESHGLRADRQDRRRRRTQP